MRDVYTTNKKSAVACKIIGGKFDRQKQFGNIDFVEGKIVTCILKKVGIIKLNL
jgi:hypothetical protein